MRELISHPPDASGNPIRLWDHLNDTACRAASLILRLKTYLRLGISAEDIARASFIASCTHDFGKAKEQFQDYIYGGKGKDKDHAAISSVFTFIVASDFFGQKSQPTRLLPFVCAYAVNRHHGILCNLEEAFEEASIEHQIAIARGKIDKRVWNFEFNCVSLDLTIRFADYRKLFENVTADQIARRFKEFATCLREKAGENNFKGWLMDLYFSLLLIVSSLIEADVACIVHATEPKGASRLDPERVRNYAFTQPKASETFQKLRERAWEEIQKKLPEQKESILRLTLPTGLGKTLMGLYLSASLQSQSAGLHKQTELQPVVYALPYLSIIEQATQVARQVFPKDVTGISVIQHHSMSFPDRLDEGAFNFERARFALEDWDADLVVTTFDQLFYSFFSQDRGFIRRFFRLPGAVLLLDEVQTISARLLLAVDAMLENLRERLSARLVYMTATHPPFLKKAESLVHKDENYFRNLSRTQLRLQLEPTHFSKYVDQLGDWLLERKDKKILLVTNTIRSSRELFAHLMRLKEEKVSEFQDLRLFHLSGSVVPVERLRRIREIRRLIETSSCAWICVVSTQCVEAGVDLDMDEAVRDFAPWDSLLQICGRVNRSGKRQRANVWIHRWVDDGSNRGREFHNYVYDSVFTDTTLDILSDYKIVKEERYWDVQQRYTVELERRLSGEVSKGLLRSALAWQFDELDFQKLFRGQEKAWKVSIFCVADQTSEYLKNIVIELWSSKNPRGALNLLCEFCDKDDLFRPIPEFLGIKPKEMKYYAKSLAGETERRLRFSLTRLLQPLLQSYTISIPIRQLNKLPAMPIVEGFFYFPSEVYQVLNICEKRHDLSYQNLTDWII